MEVWGEEHEEWTVGGWEKEKGSALEIRVEIQTEEIGRGKEVFFFGAQLKVEERAAGLMPRVF